MGYHINDIPRGVFGEVSKITEEYLEFRDAIDQNNVIMAMVELSDLIGAIEAYAKGNFGISLQDLIVMKEATRRAFEDGTRTNRNGGVPPASSWDFEGLPYDDRDDFLSKLRRG